ncbi:AAA domain-containing protein [Janibacter melonis]|uniref:AAA domain-containing protein n=1 Tax=Janibacter melonis TaxID=262209 RepID=A0A5P8FJ92_9MICO|nr:MoxR family ATPase [Janibacter melonis]QFQ29625.2 AAA domain-containing protein [Janibacter melonis]
MTAARRFTSVEHTSAALAEAGYIASDAIATTVYLADVLGKPLLVEGPAGVGKTELSKAVAAATGAELIRLQCYEGVDEARALYEWNHAKQLLRITAAGAHHDSTGADEADWQHVRDDIFTDEFLLDRPLLKAVRSEHPTVLLVDELDKADVEIEGLLLEILSDFAVTVPELGTITARHTPFVVLTSNATRELSEALRRRCLYLHIDYPEAALEQRIVSLKVPELDATLAESVVRLVGALREMRLRKSPSVAETIDWARTLIALGGDSLDPELVRSSLGVLLKHQEDIDTATARLDLTRALA